MFILLRGLILSLATGMLSFPAYAGEVPKEQGKSLDEQVQELKDETLGLGVQMRLLEEKLLYPSSTQVAVYVSVDNAGKFRLDSIEIRLDGKPAARHLYSPRELEALQKGGVQRIYVGNISSGEHGLQVVAAGRTSAGPDFRSTETFTFSKDAGPKVLEVRLTDSDARMITLRE